MNYQLAQKFNRHPIETKTRMSSWQFYALIRQHKNEEVKSILKAYSLHNYVDSSEMTVFYLAAKANNVELMQFLFDMGCAINTIPKYDETPLFPAALLQYLAGTKFLRDNDADPFTTTVRGKTALQIILDEKQSYTDEVYHSCFKNLMRKTCNDIEALASIVAKNNCRLDAFVKYMNSAEITRLLQFNYQLHEDTSRIVVKHLFKSADLEHIEILLKCGMFTYRRSSIILKTLYNAIVASSRNLTFIRLFVERLLSFNMHSESILGFLQRIFQKANAKIIDIFLKYNIDVEVRKKFNKEIALHLFANEKVKAFEVMHGRKINLNGKGVRGYSSLHFAVMNLRSNNYTEILLILGANPNAKDNCGCSPLFYARRKTDVRLLLEYGANPQMLDNLKDDLFSCNSPNLDYVLAHLAMLRGQGLPIKAQIKRQIQISSKYSKMYNRFCEQVERMRKCEVSEIVTKKLPINLLSVLGKKPEDTVHCVKTKKAIAKLMKQSEELQLHSYYTNKLKYKLRRVLHMYDLKCKTAKIIAANCDRLTPDHLVVDRILRFLNYKDLLVFDQL